MSQASQEPDRELDAMTSRMYFPLGTSLESAQHPGLDVAQRAKQASVLFDEIILETGMYQMDVLEDAEPMERYIAAEALTLAQVDAGRCIEPGTKAGIVLRRVDDGFEIIVGSGLPELNDASYYLREVTDRYVAEFHTPVLIPLAAMEADWIRSVAVQGRGVMLADDRGDQVPTVTDVDATSLPKGSDAGSFSRIELNSEEARILGEELSASGAEGRRTREPHNNAKSSLEVVMNRHFAEAAKIAESLEASFNVTEAYAQVASARGVALSMPGEEGLRFFVPNFSGLPWEAIADFRSHPAAQEARDRLRAFEERALREGLPGSPEHIRATAAEVTTCLISATQELAPKLGEDLRGPVLGTAVSIVPVVGQYLSLASSMGDLIAAVRQHHAYEGSWLAAIFELREEAIASLLE